MTDDHCPTCDLPDRHANQAACLIALLDRNAELLRVRNAAAALVKALKTLSATGWTAWRNEHIIALRRLEAALEVCPEKPRRRRWKKARVIDAATGKPKRGGEFRI
jgi:hypothetical protein